MYPKRWYDQSTGVFVVFTEVLYLPNDSGKWRLVYVTHNGALYEGDRLRSLVPAPIHSSPPATIDN